ncbi:MAG TPA: SDR family NAD(P)-dependent oxidoreductase [Ignavibacteria bacterium]|nr:SDR family NAD(P)-dependent oxidoreductase [Ignavibacteria bacterium]
MEFENKTILLTGASTGIGEEIAKKLAMINCRLILLARRTNLIEEYLSELNNIRADIDVIQCDVAKKDSVYESMIKIRSKIKSKIQGMSKNKNNIDIAILNAGISYRTDITEFNSKHAEEIFGVNVMGIIYWVEQLLPEMMERKNGMIVGVSSLADSRGHAKSEFYCASKAAATKILEGLRVELHSYNIKVVTVKPGFVETPMTSKNKFKMPLLMKPEKAADIILRGIEKEKPVIAFPMPIVFASWLGGILPSRVYEFFAKRVKVR